MKDLKDPNPDVRATAVDTIASLSLIVDEHSLPGNLSTKSNFFKIVNLCIDKFQQYHAASKIQIRVSEKQQLLVVAKFGDTRQRS
jgi:hypothetical protein